jgi:hypothetical protein
MTISSKNMQVSHRSTIMAIGAIITIVGNIIGRCVILIKFGEDWFIFNGGCWGVFLNKR